MNSPRIGDMKLYRHTDRVHRALAAAGLDRGADLTVDALTPFDQLHYHGTDAVDVAIERLGLGPDSHVLDIGSGIGGPARYMAQRSGCRVTAVELQQGLHALAEDLTGRCGLSGLVTHRCGDVLALELEEGGYDAAVSWLAVYHIADQPALWSRLHNWLRIGGQVLVEDLCEGAPMQERAAGLMRDALYSRYLVPAAQYEQMPVRSGFKVLRLEDLSADWAAFTHQRLQDYLADRARQLEVQGEPTVRALEDFYRVVDELFQDGGLGGLRFQAVKE